jgi:hypothetical protein
LNRVQRQTKKRRKNKSIPFLIKNSFEKKADLSLQEATQDSVGMNPFLPTEAGLMAAGVEFGSRGREEGA